MEPCAWNKSIYAINRGEVANEYEKFVRFGSGGLAVGSQRIILVDLSDTTNFPHGSTDKIYVTNIHTHLDGTSSTAAQIYYCWINAVGSNNSTIHQFHEDHIITGNKSSMSEYNWTRPVCLDTGNSMTGGSQGILTDTYLPDGTVVSCPSAAGTCQPGAGDLLARVIVSAGDLTGYGICIHYYTR